MGDKLTPPFVSLALKICERLQIDDTKTRGIVMGYCKKNSIEKVIKVVKVAETFPWRYKNPAAAFLKAVGIVNKHEKKQTSKTT